METKRSLESIRKFVKETTEKNFQDYLGNHEIIKVKKILDEKSNKEEKKFTFTIGELNAYLG